MLLTRGLRLPFCFWVNQPKRKIKSPLGSVHVVMAFMVALFAKIVSFGNSVRHIISSQIAYFAFVLKKAIAPALSL